jgi:hypothetical protein
MACRMNLTIVSRVDGASRLDPAPSGAAAVRARASAIIDGAFFRWSTGLNTLATRHMTLAIGRLDRAHRYDSSARAFRRAQGPACILTPLSRVDAQVVPAVGSTGVLRTIRSKE